MRTLLELDSSPLSTSISRELTVAFVAKWQAAHPDGKVIARDLALHPPKPVDQAFVYAMHTPEEAQKPEQKEALAYSEQCLAEIHAADDLVMGVAMHNFSIPAVLKLWIDQVIRPGKTFAYGAKGPMGLLKGKKATILLATGGVYDQGTPYAPYNFVEPYLRAVLGFIGIADVTFVTAGGTSELNKGADRGQFLAPHLSTVRSLAV